MSHFFTSDGSQKKNRIVGVRDYEESFPDSQPQQLDAALRYGVKPVLIVLMLRSVRANWYMLVVIHIII